MIYNSFNFLVFFPLIFLLYYVLPAKYNRIRNIYLLVVSYLLYIQWSAVHALILLGVSVVSYLTAIGISKYDNKKCLIAILGGTFSLTPLLFYKYYDFVNEQIYEVLSIMGIRCELYGLNWAIPIGISFFTFQSIGYVMDVYYQRIKPEWDFVTYALFISFFPSLVSGPINKASLIIPQINNIRPYFNYAKGVEGLKMLLWGMFMKVVVADRLGIYVDTIFPHYMNYTGATCLIASFAYTIQIYADFAGYSFMAIGIGKVLGFELAENFRRPYFAVSITDFWRRWHISLSIWLRDYIYIPMGGSRCSKHRNYWNIFVTFLVSGIWHGANWTFIVWGIWHGIAQIFEKIIGQQGCAYGTIGKMIKILMTFLLVNFAWIFFRMPSIGDALDMLIRIFDLSLPMSVYVDIKQNFPYSILGVTLLFMKDVRDEFFPSKMTLMNNRCCIVRWVTYVVLMCIILLTGVLDSGQFIYASF